MAEATILDTIVAQRRKDVAADRAAAPLAALHARLDEAPEVIGFAERLRASAPMAVMAEIKRASPSKGDIAPEIDAVRQGRAYAHAGAAAISVLTEPTWFKGTIADMAGVRAAIDGMPDRPAVLRKDFVIDEYQVVEARVHGADTVLLIVASLDDATLCGLMDVSRGLGMEPLVEVNSADEMERALRAGSRVIGVNNRDLRTFNVDLGTTDRLAGMVPEDVILAALSGIATRDDVVRFEQVGATAVLVGEALMRTPDPAAMIRELRGL